MRSLRITVSLFLPLLFWGIGMRAAELNAVPRQVQFAGRVNLTTADTEGLKGVTFALFSEQTGGSALWMDTERCGRRGWCVQRAARRGDAGRDSAGYFFERRGALEIGRAHV